GPPRTPRPDRPRARRTPPGRVPAPRGAAAERRVPPAPAARTAGSAAHRWTRTTGRRRTERGRESDPGARATARLRRRPRSRRDAGGWRAFRCPRLPTGRNPHDEVGTRLRRRRPAARSRPSRERSAPRQIAVSLPWGTAALTSWHSG